MDTKEIPSGSIAVGVDGSDSSARAVVWAAGQARLEHRALVLLHARDFYPSVREPGFDRPEVLAALREEGQHLVDSAELALQDDHPGLDVHRVVRLADPRETLIDLSNDAAMIVLGSRGRGPVRSLLLGSVGVAVSQHAHCPVVVLRPPQHEPIDNTIVVGVQAVPSSNNAVEFAYRQASLRSVPLLIVHGFWDPFRALPQSGATTGAEMEAEERFVVSEVVASMKEKFPDVDVSYQMTRGQAEDCLVRASQGHSMVVVGSHHTNTAVAVLRGEVSRAVTEHAHCAVAVVPE